jgi:uncharacterized protein
MLLLLCNRFVITKIQESLTILFMEYRSIKGFTGWGQLGFLFAFFGAGFVLANFLQIGFGMLVLPPGAKITDTDALMTAMLAPENVGIMRLSQVVATLIAMFIPAILWSFASNGKEPIWLGFSKHINGFQILLGFMIIFSAGIAVSPLADLTKSIVIHFPKLDATAKSLDATYAELTAAMSNLKSLPEYIIALFIMAFFPAMFEEVFFRGAMQNLLVKWLNKPIVAIIITSLVFSLVHSSIYLFLSRAALGFVLGLMYYKTKNIWVNIIAHFLNNAILLTGLYFMKAKTGKIDLEKMDSNWHWSLGLVGIVALVGLFFILTKYSAKNKAKIEGEERLLVAASLPKEPISHFQNN